MSLHRLRSDWREVLLLRFEVSFLADTKFPVAFTVVSNPGENVSLRKNTFCIRETSDVFILHLIQFYQRDGVQHFHFHYVFLLKETSVPQQLTERD